MDIKYYVRTTGEREFDYSPLKYEILLDKEHRGIRNYIEVLRRTDSQNAVILEDDLVLCKNFQEEIEKVIEQYPDTIINFFTSPYSYFTTHFSESFSYNQCTYFPKGYGINLANEMVLYLDNRYNQSYGSVLNMVLTKKGIYHLVYRPCLVQHIDGKSVFQRTDTIYQRNTIYFKGYLDELGIDYSQAFEKENRKKLEEMLNNDREKWYGKYDNYNKSK